jgi:CheY-like chemotaxis protein
MPSQQSGDRSVILLVEEETLQREDIASYLVSEGFSVLEAVDSKGALALLESQSHVDGLVTNAHIPGRMEGFELASLVRKRWPSVAVVLISGHSDPSSGPVPEGGEFVAKPYLLEHLAPTLRRMLQRA